MERRGEQQTIGRSRSGGGTVPATGLFLGEGALGHRTVYENLRAVGEGAALRVEHVPELPGPLLLKLPIPRTVKSLLAYRRAVTRLVRSASPEYLVANTHKPIALCHDVVGRVPTAIMLDATPLQYDALRYVDDPSDSVPGVPAVKYRLVRALFHRAAALLPWSSWAGNSLESDYGVPRERIFVTPPPVDTQLWALVSKPPRSQLELVFVGGDFERKGGPELLDWFRRVGTGRVRLTFVTRSPVAEEPGVRVVRAGANSEELRALVQGADVFVLPTKADCFSIAGQEAMASGVPVVLGDVGGIPDLVEEGVTGYLVRPGSSTALDEPLERLLSSGSLRRDMGVAARDRAVEMFDSRRIFDRITAIGETIRGRGSSGSNDRPSRS